ncbi:MAG: hypothetical protein JNJ80_00520, partial [Gemmatimonadetes bacterium]|nr:hypothetical protein [Gemmatimonadota bacterium]
MALPRRWAGFLAVTLAAGTSLTAQTNSPLATRHDAEKPAHDATHYDVWIRLADSGSVFQAAVSTRWTLRDSTPIRINLDPAYRITKVTVDDRPATHRRAGNDLILVSIPAGAGPRVVTRIEYQGAPPKFERQGRKSGLDDGLVQRGSGASRKIFADNWPNRARKWLAAQDHPSDKATVAWTIEAPSALTVVANGTETERTDLGGGMTRWRFSIEQPIPVYTMVIGAARLAVTKLAAAQC